ncbi:MULTISPECIES: hypothetical protein [Nostocales]|nr:MULTISPECIES: hypothetical protein [Nostocales]
MLMNGELGIGDWGLGNRKKVNKNNYQCPMPNAQQPTTIND